MNDSGGAIFTIVLLVIRIIITVYCVNKAGDLNRSKGGWGIFGFLLPIVALIWIQFMKPKMIWEDQSEAKSQTGMSDSDNTGCIAIILYGGTIALSIVSGVLAWNWVEPESFFGAIGFIILWGILSTIGHYIAMGIVALFGGMN